MSLEKKMVEHINIKKNEYNILLDAEVWKSKSRMWGDKMHRICSYVAMFSPALANHFITKYSEKGDIVLDAFSGRGTTLLESRLNERIAYAIDLNPFAFVLTKSKAESFDLEEVKARINEWEKKWRRSKELYKIQKNDEEMRIYYSDWNLEQLIFIKNNYGVNWQFLDSVDNFILAICLGIMHGPVRKKGDSIYFSLGMSNHTSMSKNYVKKYALKNKLKKPVDNLFFKIRNRVEFILKKSKYLNESQARVVNGNSLNLANYFPDLKPKLIFTSPPYLNIVNYTSQNWIKMWLLGFDTPKKTKEIGLNDKHNAHDYKIFIKNFLLSVKTISNRDTKVILVIGDVQKYEKVYKFEDMWEEIKEDLPNFKLTDIYIDHIEQRKKATNSMGKKAGKATRIDKIFIFNFLDDN